jgi:uncharacterized protein
MASDRDPAILQAITDYNEEDCLSTLKLRDWLIERKAEAERRSVSPFRGRPPSRTRRPRSVLRRRADRPSSRATSGARHTGGALLCRSPQLPSPRGPSLSGGRIFDRQKKSLDDLLDDTEAIAYLTPVEGVAPEKVKQSLIYTLQFPDQDTSWLRIRRIK